MKEPVEHIDIRSYALAKRMLETMKLDGTPEGRKIMLRMRGPKERAESKAKRPRQVDEKKDDHAEALDLAMTALSRYVRTRDTRPCGEKRRGACITCENPKWYAELTDGHWISTQFWGTKFHPFNNHGQCWGCNSKMMGNGRVKEHEAYIIAKHGAEWPEKLKFLAKVNSRKLTAPELLKIAADFDAKTDAILAREAAE